MSCCSKFYICKTCSGGNAGKLECPEWRTAVALEKIILMMKEERKGFPSDELR